MAVPNGEAGLPVQTNVDPISVVPGENAKASTWVPVKEDPIFTPRKLRVVLVGAGMSGLTFAHKWKHEWKAEEWMDLVVYEKNGDVGGTWLENRYPGVACDV